MSDWAVRAERGFLPPHPAQSGSAWLDHAGGCLHPASRSLLGVCQQVPDFAWLVLLPLGLLMAWRTLQFSSACVQTCGCYLSTAPPSRLPTPGKFYLVPVCRLPAQPQPALLAHPWAATARCSSTHCHPAAAVAVPLSVLWGFPLLTEGRIRPSAAAVSALCFMGSSCCCITGIQGTSVVRYLTLVFALWRCPFQGTRGGTRSHVPCRQGCAACHALHFTVNKRDEGASVQLSLLVHLQAD